MKSKTKKMYLDTLKQGVTQAFVARSSGLSKDMLQQFKEKNVLGEGNVKILHDWLVSYNAREESAEYTGRLDPSQAIDSLDSVRTQLINLANFLETPNFSRQTKLRYLRTNYKSLEALIEELESELEPENDNQD